MLAAHLTDIASVARQTPYSSKEKLRLGAVIGQAQSPRYQVEELSVDADGTFDNPFDPEDVKLEAEVIPPSGNKLSIPGFYEQDFSRSLVGDAEKLQPIGKPGWRIRVCPEEKGNYRVKVRFQDRTGFKTAAFAFESQQSTEHGPIRVSQTDRHYFESQDGTSYFPIGENLAWTGSKGTFDYDDWIDRLGKSGANFIRLIIGPSWSPFALERAGDLRQGAGAGMIDLASAWRLDHVMGKAASLGISASLCLDSQEELQIRGDRPDWDHNPLNRDNGGPLRVWTDFWSNPATLKIYRERLRYLVARYGPSENLFAWELWNDVDLVPEYDAGTVSAWHASITKDLKSMDPYRHLISTSFANPRSGRDTFLLPEIDFDEIHASGGKMVGALATLLQSRQEWGKPCLITEVEADKGSPHAQEDPQGVQVHDSIWISIVTGGAGGASPWFWDSLVDAKNLYGLFGAAAKFLSDVSFPKQAFHPVEAAVKGGSSNIWSMVGNDEALAWVQPKGRSWDEVVRDGVPLHSVAESEAVLSELASGTWNVEYWDTWKGARVGSSNLRVGLDGKAAIRLPSFTRDIAIKMKLQPRS